MHKEKLAEGDPHYWVMAKVCEPDYAAELKFLKAEIAFVERKLDGPWPAYTDKLSVPVLGILGRNDWLKYHRKLHHYGERLEVYSEEVEAGVVPLKFAVYNASEHADHHIAIRVRVEDGRIDDKKKAPVRPERIDGSGKSHGLKWLLPSKFSRRGVKVTGHAVAAEFSQLDGHDGAALITQIVHLHCEPDTDLTYEIRSRNVDHETGEVTF